MNNARSNELTEAEVEVLRRVHEEGKTLVGLSDMRILRLYDEWDTDEAPFSEGIRMPTNRRMERFFKWATTAPRDRE